MPMAKQARKIRTEKLGLVHSVLFSQVIFREIGHLTTIPIFLSNQCKKSTNYKTRMDPRDLQNLIILYCDYIIQHAHKKQKKTYPSQSSCNPLDTIIVSHVYKTTRPLPKFRAAKPTQQVAIREQIELHPSQRDFLLPNITFILIIYSGPVAKTVRIKNHGQASPTSQLESIRFRYLRLK